MSKTFVFTLGLALLIAGAAPAGAEGRAEHGRTAARQICGNCHVFEGVGGKDAVPSLNNIANDPENTPGFLKVWLSTPHARMPDFNLSRQQIDDLIAYLQSLKDK